MIRYNEFDKYYAEISDENFTEEDRQNALYLWELLLSVEPFMEWVLVNAVSW